VDVIIHLDQIVEIIIPKIMQKMVEEVMIHLSHHPHGLVVVIIHVVEDRLGIEYDLMMIGKHYQNFF
jgi:hypothetical protein